MTLYWWANYSHQWWYDSKWGYIPHPGCLLALYSNASKCIEDDTKAAARWSPNCIKKTINKIQREMIFNMACEILLPCNMACGSGIMTLNSRSGSTRNVARGSGMTCHWIRLVAVPWLLILSVHLCAHPSVIFPYSVLKRPIDIIVFSSIHGSAIITGILFPILNNFTKVGQVPPTGSLNTDVINKFHDYY